MNRWSLSYWKILGAVALAALTLHGDARGTTFVLMSDEDLVQGSAAIVVGTVQSIAPQASSQQQIETEVTLKVDESVKGIRQSTVTIAVPGGSVGGVQRVVYGAPQFYIGEKVVVFLRQRPDGALTPLGLAMGKYTIVQRPTGAVVRRQLGGKGTSVLALDKGSGALMAGEAEDERALAPFIASMREIVSKDPLGREEVAVLPPSMGAGEASAAFTFLGDYPARWLQPDLGQTVAFGVDPTGDMALGSAASLKAVSAAMAAWNGAGSRLRITSSGAATAAPYMACDGKSTIQFNDPFGEIGQPVNCGGALAIGGFCSTANSTSSVGGATFYTITEGDLTVNNGFGGCAYWTPVNVAETITHELGHSIGLGHSSETWPESNAVLDDATMYYLAHFDGRGAALRSDDIAAVHALYPGASLVRDRPQRASRPQRRRLPRHI